MLSRIIAAFCIIDDALQALGYKDDPQAKTPASAILTLAILAAMELGGKHNKALALFLLGQEGIRAYELARERARLEEALRQAEARVARLEAEVKAAKDPAYLEALVRRLGFVRQEEILRRR